MWARYNLDAYQKQKFSFSLNYSSCIPLRLSFFLAYCTGLSGLITYTNLQTATYTFYAKATLQTNGQIVTLKRKFRPGPSLVCINEANSLAVWLSVWRYIVSIYRVILCRHCWLHCLFLLQTILMSAAFIWSMMGSPLVEMMSSLNTLSLGTIRAASWMVESSRIVRCFHQCTYCVTFI